MFGIHHAQKAFFRLDQRYTEVNVPTLEERLNERIEEKNLRIESRTLEMGITHTFSKYLEQMELYLLELEKRVALLEDRLEKERSKKG